MRLSTQLASLPGVARAAVMMGTDSNKVLLADSGMLTEDARRAAANDLIIAIDAESDDAAERARARVGAFIARPEELRGGRPERRPRSVSQGLARFPVANLLVVSTPGPYAGGEALKGLHLGLHVFVFSDNVPVEQEVFLKQVARRRRLLVMGPGAGTSVLSGTGIGFANHVERGEIGIVGPSGTGIQEIMVLISRFGAGISHAIGTGSRDLSEPVGGLSTLEVLEALHLDPATRAIVLVAKPPSPEVAQRLLDSCREVSKPTIGCFLGQARDALAWGRVVPARTLEEAAIRAVEAVRGAGPAGPTPEAQTRQLGDLAEHLRRGLAPEQRYIRGLFSGGSLCAEALTILEDRGIRAFSNTPLLSDLRLADVQRSREHTCIDMGTEEFTVGRPHPMIDFSARVERLHREAQDPTVAVLLLDIVLGYGAHPDPAQALAPAIHRARTEAAAAGGSLLIAGSVCGTNGDPQQLTSQERRLTVAGMIVLPTNAQAALLSAMVASGRSSEVTTG
jgi:succinyl-CoA synthetase alpha subunit